jgi:transcriptional regulator with XRE-family HTH domain
MARKKTEFADKIKALREAAGMNQAQLAAALGVTHPLVSQSESGKKIPSTDLLVRLGSVAADLRRYEDAKWFWEQAGMNTTALDNLVDIRVQERAASPGEFIEVAALDPNEKRTIPFPSRFLSNPASTRYMRVRAIKGEDAVTVGWQIVRPGLYGYPFGPGDVLLVDPTQRELHKLERGSFVAVSVRGVDVAGALEVRPVGSEVFHFSLIAPGHSDLYIGAANAAIAKQIQAVNLISGCSVLGRIIAWISKGEAQGK